MQSKTKIDAAWEAKVMRGAKRWGDLCAVTDWLEYGYDSPEFLLLQRLQAEKPEAWAPLVVQAKKELPEYQRRHLEYDHDDAFLA